MSLIDSDSGTRLDSFYETEFIETARILCAQDVQMLTTGFDPQCPTYFIERKKKVLEPADFELSPENPDAVKQSLQMLWNEPESSALANLVSKILSLSPRFLNAEDVSEISPFVYVIF